MGCSFEQERTIVATCLQEIRIFGMPPSRDEKDASSASICAPLGSLSNVANVLTNSIANVSIDILNDNIFLRIMRSYVTQIL
jgi:hypothetical protein